MNVELEKYIHVIDELLVDLWPIHRTLAGPGFRQSLSILSSSFSSLQLKSHQYPSGSNVYDWTVPNEWYVESATLHDDKGNLIIDYNHSNLHLVAYSQSVQTILPLSELKHYLHSDPSQPDYIPYVTSYYQSTWGFCLPHHQLLELNDGYYHVNIKTHTIPGNLEVGEIYLPGSEPDEILISTYLCHPSMANNELSGPIASFILADILAQRRNRYSYRFLFTPETIGCISYLSDHLPHLQKHTKAGFVLTCIGDNGPYSAVHTPSETSLADRAVKLVLQTYNNTRTYSWLDRGSDERQYCWPGVDLPVLALCRSKFGTYPQYHTSGDDLSFVKSPYILDSIAYVLDILFVLENNMVPVVQSHCEPFLSRYDLYPTSSTKSTYSSSRDILNLLAYSNGARDLIEISELTNIDFKRAYSLCMDLIRAGIMSSI